MTITVQTGFYSLIKHSCTMQPPNCRIKKNELSANRLIEYFFFIDKRKKIVTIVHPRIRKIEANEKVNLTVMEKKECKNKR